MNLQSQNNNLIEDETPFYIERLKTKKSSQNVFGYYVKSTAKYDVDDLENIPPPERVDLKQIAQELFDKNNPQLVIYIHGYNVKPKDARKRSEEIYEFAASNFQCENNIFLGYRWPAENRREKGDFPLVDRDKLVQAFTSLPILLLALLTTAITFGLTSLLLTAYSLFIGKPPVLNWMFTSLITLVVSIILSLGLRWLGKAEKVLRFFPPLLILAFSAAGISAVFSLISGDKNLDWLLGFILIPLVISIVILSIVLALILLRLSTYPRDRHRASNYGVIDLVELLRNLDKEVFELACQNKNIPPEQRSQISGIDEIEIGKNRIKLSFIAHSLGCEIATQTIRILSDVFDPLAIGEIEDAEITKNPDRQIGHIFELERLVMVAPDIPVESILTGRANFLKSSLRRCKEAYVFCSEADLALRVASTAANYISFPTQTRFRGYKLGNITAKHFLKGKPNWRYGICNIEESVVISPSIFLELRASDIEYQEFCQLNSKKESDIADLFTYFDCTDYKDKIDSKDEAILDPRINQEGGIVSFAEGKKALNFFWDYIRLSFFRPKYLDVHGGYFDGQFSRQLMYGLAFLGFKGLLSKHKWDCNDLHTKCCDKGVQVILSPSRSQELQSIPKSSNKKL